MNDLQQGRLEQVCPACGLREAAGPYCSACLTKTDATDWRKAVLTDAQRAARTSRHSTPKVVATDTKTADPALLAAVAG